MMREIDYLVLVTPEAPLHVLGTILWRVWEGECGQRFPEAADLIQELGALEDEESHYGVQTAKEVLEGLVGADSHGQRGVLTYWQGALADVMKIELWVRLRFLRGK